jgi:hypothetical protein
MIKKTNILIFGIFTQLFATQSILMFNLFDLANFWQIKKFLHPAGVGLAILYVVILKKHKKTYSAIDTLLALYLLVYLILSIPNHEDLASFYYTIRDNFMVLALIMIYSNTKIKPKVWLVFLKFILVFVLLNICAVLVNFIIGYEDYMELVTGRFVWGHDPEYNFKISFFYNFIRSPGLIGESANLGYFGLFSLWFFLKSKEFNKYAIFPFLLALLSFTRSVYLSLFLVFLIRVFNNRQVLKFLIKYFWVIFSLILFFVVLLYSYNIFEAESLFMRIEDWGKTAKPVSSYLFGGELGKIGTAVIEADGQSILDSYWLTTFLSFGVLGVILIVSFINSKHSKHSKDIELSVFLIAIGLSGFFVTLTQSITFLVMFPLIFLKKDDLTYT